MRRVATAFAAVLAILVMVCGTATAAAADDGDTGVAIGAAGDTSFRLHDPGSGFRLEVARAGAVLWESTAGAVSVKFDGIAAPVSAHYSTAVPTDDGVVATGEVSTPAGSTVQIVDTYRVVEDALQVQRVFSVASLAGADSNRGMSVQYPLRNTAVAAPASYQWFAPGAWYGNGSDTFSDRNKLAFDGTETAITVDALSAPLFAAFDAGSGLGLTLADRTDGRRQTVVADREPQHAKTIVDANLDLPGLGLRHVSASGSHTEIVHSYPGSTINYRNRFSGKPKVLRYLPMTSGLVGDTAFSIRLRGYDGFLGAVRDVWRAAFAADAVVVNRFDTKIHFDTLVDYVDASYGLDDGWRSYYTNYGLHVPSSGFLWRNADTAWVMLAQGWSRQDEGMRERARNVITDQLAKGGFDYSNPRSTAEAHLNLLRAYLEDEEHGSVNPTWLAKVVSYANGLPAAAPYYATEALLLLSEKTGNAAYRAKAVAGVETAWADGQNQMRFRAALEDYAGGPPELDREAGYLALEAYMALYRHETNAAAKQTWLDRARIAADYGETWAYVQDLAMVPVGADPSLLFYGNDHVPSYGITGIHVGASGGDVYQALNAYEYWELAQATGDSHYAAFAEYIERNATLYTNMGDKAGLMADSTKNTGLGFGNEYLGTSANDYWNNNQRGDGNASNIGWLTYVLLAMTQRTLDFTDAYSLVGSTVNDINGLDAYYQLVNVGTGEALDVADDARTSGAALVTTIPDAGQDRAQQWLFEPMDDGAAKIVNRSTAKVVTIPDGDETVGREAVQEIWYPGLASTFDLEPVGDGSVRIVSRVTGRYLEVDPATTSADGHRVQQNVDSGTDLQRWVLRPVGDLQLLAPTESTALTAGAGSVDFAPFDGIAGLGQRWSAVGVTATTSAIVSRSSGLALAAEGGSVSLRQPDGADPVFGPAQQWRVECSTDGDVHLVNAADDAVRLELRMQTAGPATIEAPVSIVQLSPVEIIASADQTAHLPGEVGATRSDGSTAAVPVTWEAIPTQVGVHRVLGTVSGLDARAVATVTVIPSGAITAVAPVVASTSPGVAPLLPGHVDVQADGADVQLPVTWAAIDPAQYAIAGVFTVPGLVVGTSVSVTATVTVTAPEAAVPVSVAPVTVDAERGRPVPLPVTVSALMSDASTASVPVSWPSGSDAAPTDVGYTTVVGDAQGVPVTATVRTGWFFEDFASSVTGRFVTGGNKTFSASGGAYRLPVQTYGTSSYAFATPGGTALTVSGDVLAEATVTVSQVGNAGIWFRGAGTTDSTGYFFGIEGHTTSWVAGKQISGAWSQFTYQPGGWAIGSEHHLRVTISGTTLRYYIDDMSTPVYTRTDTQFAAGTFGLRSWSAAMVADDFSVRPIPAAVSVVAPGTVTTFAGTAPTLPAQVGVRDASGETVLAPATWDAIAPSAYATPGTSFTAGGTVRGLPVQVTVAVRDVAQIVDARRPVVLTSPGVAPALPSTVVATFEGGSTSSVPVTWSTRPAADFASPGWVQVDGMINGTSVATAAAVGVAAYADSFASGNVAGWTTYAGAWSLDTAKRFGPATGSTSGEKALANGTSITDGIYQGTVRVGSGSDAGLISRATNAAIGADNYRGYYVGFSVSGDSIILGRANNGWTQLASAPYGSDIVYNQDITLRAIAVGSTIQVFAGDMTTPKITYTDTASPAITSGQIGVRGYNSAYRVSGIRLATLPPIVSADDVAVTALADVAPVLPKTVTVTRMDGLRSVASVTWNSTVRTPTANGYRVSGTAAGLAVTAEVTVSDAIPLSVETATVTTQAGTRADLPETVRVRFSDGSVRDAAVSSWRGVPITRYGTVGSFIVQGLAVVGDRTFAIRARVVVVPSAPVATPGAGTYGTVQSVTFATLPVDATIHVTTDGSQPTSSSPVYTGPIEIATTTTLRAIAVAPSGEISPVSVTTITISDVVAPVTSFSLDGRVITLTATDAGTGVEYMEVSIDGGAWTPVTGPVELDADAHEVAYRATDRAGNVSVPATVVVPASGASPTALVADGVPRTVEPGATVMGLAARAVTASGAPIVGASITFDVTGPGYFVAGSGPATAVTNAAGYALSPQVIATAPGAIVVTASAEGVDSVDLPPITVVTPAETLDVDVSVVGGTAAGKSTVTVVVTNTSNTVVKAVLKTKYGSKTFADLAVGATVSATFKTNLVTAPAGTATVVVSTNEAQRTFAVAYPPIGAM